MPKVEKPIELVSNQSENESLQKKLYTLEEQRKIEAEFNETLESMQEQHPEVFAELHKNEVQKQEDSREQQEISNKRRVSTAWAMLEAIRLSKKASWNNLEEMQAVMRKFALTLVEQQPFQNKIEVAGHILIEFPNSDFQSKTDYLRHHSIDTEWGDDPLLCVTLEALGYQPVIHLAGTHVPPYNLFVQQCSANPMRCDIVNHGAKDGGFHWELQGKTNPGAGNCMYYTLAQVGQLDYKKIAIDPDEVLDIQEILSQSESNTSVKQNIVSSTAIVREENSVTLEIQRQFKEFENSRERPDLKRKEQALSVMEKYSTEQLVKLYAAAMNADGDYLKGRLKAFEQEQGIDAKSNPIRNAVENGVINQDLKEIIHDELLHALSMEAYRNPNFHYAKSEMPVCRPQ